MPCRAVLSRRWLPHARAGLRAVGGDISGGAVGAATPVPAHGGAVPPRAMRCWVLAALAVLAAAPGAAEEPALRLCGREFIRTLVALCRGTRWSRPPRAAFGEC